MGDISIGNESGITFMNGNIHMPDIGLLSEGSGGPNIQIDLQSGKLFYTGVSDERLKTNIIPYSENVTNLLNQILICSFDYKSTPEVENLVRRLNLSNKNLIEASKATCKNYNHVGAIAQKVKKIFPTCVSGSDD